MHCPHSKIISVDHATVNRWVVKYSPQLDEVFHRRKRPVWRRWRMDETDIRVKGQWTYLDRAVDKHGQPIDFLLTAPRDEQAAMGFLTQAIRSHGVSAQIPIDGSETNAAAIRSDNAAHGTAIDIRQMKYLNNLVERVLTQLPKTHLLTPRLRRYDVADCDFFSDDDDTIDPHCNQLAPLLECGTVYPCLHPLTKGLDWDQQSCHLGLPIYWGLELGDLGGDGL